MTSRIGIAAACIALAIGCTASVGAATQKSTKWTLGTPIVTYWAGLGSGFMPINDNTAAQLAAGGWNLGWADAPADLDVYYRHGIRAMLVIGTPDVNDPAQCQKLDALVEQVRNHPALYAYYLTDEPGSGAFPALGKLVAHLRKIDPAHVAYINLLPTYASDGQLQVTDDDTARAKVGYPQDFAGIPDNFTSYRYCEHLRRFVDTVRPDLISYDHYHFLAGGDGIQYFLNLSLVRKAALRAKRPFLNIVQACNSPSEGWREPTNDEERWLTYTTLAYGAQGISHFRYDVGMWKDPKTAETPLPRYWTMSQLNREFVAIATELQPLTSLAAYHCGNVPMGAEALPSNSPFAPIPKTQEILLGYFGKSAAKPTHVVVVNLDYKKTVTTTLACPGEMEIFHAATRTWIAAPGGNHIRLTLAPGGGTLVRLKK